MSREALAALYDSNSLAQTLTYEQLEAYHVDFDQLTGDFAVESQLAYWSTRRGRVAVTGDSGAGKSSVMASVLGALNEAVPENLVPARIPIELASPEVITTVQGFGSHVVNQVLRWVAPESLSPEEARRLEQRVADVERRTGRRRRAGFSIGTGRMLPVDARLSADLESAGAEFEHQLSGGDAIIALKRMVEMFRARRFEPFFVFDDTDAWLRLPGQEGRDEALASGFFGTSVRMLTRELDCGFALAVHRSYVDIPAYRRIVDSFEVIDLPALPNPPLGIAEILQRRIAIDQLEISLDSAFDDRSLDALGAIYADAPDLRRVMAVAGLAVRKAYEAEDSEMVTESAVFAARAQRDTVRDA